MGDVSIFRGDKTRDNAEVVAMLGCPKTRHLLISGRADNVVLLLRWSPVTGELTASLRWQADVSKGTSY